MKSSSSSSQSFTAYQIFIVAVIAFIQFTVILDFMVLSPLGALLMQQLSISTANFGLVVSAYAFSAGISGLLTAGFADKFDRKKLLLFFYAGFLLGTLFCALAPNFHLLLIARIVTGIFGGVISSIGLAIVTDLFALNMRGKVMGFVQMGFAVGQIIGIPVGLILANQWGWHSPFFMIAGIGALAGILIMIYMKPITAHLQVKSDRNALQHLGKTISKPAYLRAFLATTLLATGGFMLMPFGSAFGIHNLGLTMEQLPVLYLSTGVCSIFFGPLTGYLSDKIGKFTMFCIGSVVSILMVGLYTNLAITPLWIVILINVVLFAGILARMISASALVTAIPDMADRGAFMSVNASVQQLSGGLSSMFAGMIVVQQSSGKLLHYDTLGYVVIIAMLICMGMFYFLNKFVVQRKHVAVP